MRKKRIKLTEKQLISTIKNVVRDILREDYNDEPSIPISSNIRVIEVDGNIQPDEEGLNERDVIFYFDNGYMVSADIYYDEQEVRSWGYYDGPAEYDSNLTVELSDGMIQSTEDDTTYYMNEEERMHCIQVIEDYLKGELGMS